MNLVPKNYYFDDFFDNWLNPKTNSPKCDIYEKDGNYHIEIDMPGFEKNDISIEENNGYLTVSAQKNNETNTEDKNYIHRERQYSKYQRSFYIGDVQQSAIYAEYTNGTLSVILPKTNDIPSKHNIQIK